MTTFILDQITLLNLIQRIFENNTFLNLKRDWKAVVRIGLFMNVIIVLFLIAWFIAGTCFDTWEKLKVIFNMHFDKGNVWIFSTENSILEVYYSSKNETIIYCLRTMWLFSYWTIVAIYVVAGISSRFFLQKVIIYS